MALLGLVVSIVCWPIRAFSSMVHRVLEPYPKLHCLYSHSVVSAIYGMGILCITFSIENWYHTVFWRGAVESTRAISVCPLYETIATIAKYGQDLE